MSQGISEGTDHLMCLPFSDWSGAMEFIRTYFMSQGVQKLCGALFLDGDVTC